MATIDFHIHWWPPAFLEYLDKADEPSKNLPPLQLLTAPPVADLGLRTKLMDKAGIDIAVLSQPMQPDERTHPGLAKISNDGFAEIVSDRFRFFASLPLPDIDASIAELERTLAMEGCDGVILPTHVFGESLDDDKFEPLLAALNKQAITVALHPDAFRVDGVLAQWFMDWTIGAPFEDTIVALRLISSGRIDQFPDIKWIVPHAGGALAVLWQRMDKQYASNGGEVLGFTKKPSEYAGHFIYDTATQTPATLALAVGEIGADRLVMGTDFPFIDFDDMGAAVRTVEDCSALDESGTRAVLEGKAAL
jgi:aminocarboxymuconate-semialdehyde decarboxylase